MVHEKSPKAPLKPLSREPLLYIDRKSGRVEEEKVYGRWALELLYPSSSTERKSTEGKSRSHPMKKKKGDTFWRAGWRSLCNRCSTLFRRLLRGGRVFLLFLTARNAFSSKLYGWWQSRSWTRRKVLPFIEKFGIDPQEFLHPVESFSSFNDFFIRKLKKRARPIASRTDTAILPADGRYLLIPDLCDTVTTLIKGQEISLLSLLGGDLRGDTEKTKKRLEQYRRGSLLIARLCPIDYHRFHFPCEGTPGEAVLQEGSLYSVNPFALRQRLSILGENRRVVTSLQTKQFGEILYIEVGATHVGSIHQTYTPHKLHKKGEEKGFFSFGGSCLLLFFEPDVITWDKDLLQASGQGLELRGLMGEGMGVARRSS